MLQLSVNNSDWIAMKAIKRKAALIEMKIRDSENFIDLYFQLSLVLYAATLCLKVTFHIDILWILMRLTCLAVEF